MPHSARTQMHLVAGREGVGDVRGCWVVLLEAQAPRGLERETAEAVLGRLAHRYPSALIAPDRWAVQFLVVDADGPDLALVEGVAAWRRAVHEVGAADAELVRAEVKTPAELVAEYEEQDERPTAGVPADQQALAAAYEATRRLLRSSTPREVVSVLAALVRHLGGTIVRPHAGDVRVVDYDLSLGEGDPMVAAAEPYSIARLCLEEVLPVAVDDARRMATLLRDARPLRADDDILLDITEADRP